VRFRVGPASITIRARRGSVFTVPAPPGQPVSVERGGASDRFGNVNADPAVLAR
jgi:hypothetical protein